MSRPNWVLLTLIALAGGTGLALVVLAAEAHGKRRMRKAWLIERGPR